ARATPGAYGGHARPAAHSFPTRRSSDLTARLANQATTRQWSPVVWALASLSLSADFVQTYFAAVRASDRNLSGNASKAICPLVRSEEHTSELQSRFDLVCRLLLEKKKHI